MALLFTSFLAGILTIAAPCVLPLLPVIIGSALAEEDRKKPYIIIASLSVSLVLFTLILKASSVLIDIPASTWASISGFVILFFGIITLFPELWENISQRFGFSNSSNELLDKSANKKGNLGPILMGAALGPVFSSCSPTYLILVATVLPQSFAVGLVNIVVYVLGLALTLLLIAVFGQRMITKLKWLADPHGKFRIFLGFVFVIVGLAVMTGADKKIEAYLIESGIYNVSELEMELLENVM